VGSDAARVIEIYQRHAEAWSRDRGDRLFEQGWLDRFVALLPARRRTVLDIWCGPGVPIAQYLIERGCQVSGVDSSSAMIAMCVDRFPQHQWHVADMRTLTLDRTFGGILAWDSFFHLPASDQCRMFAIFKQHAAPGAVLMFTSGPSAGEQIGSYQGEPLYHASLDRAEYRTLLADNGFDVVAHVVEDTTCGLHTIWLARLR
jgi:trans-aconitate methyltransferase